MKLSPRTGRPTPESAPVRGAGAPRVGLRATVDDRVTPERNLHGRQTGKTMAMRALIAQRIREDVEDVMTHYIYGGNRLTEVISGVHGPRPPRHRKFDRFTKGETILK